MGEDEAGRRRRCVNREAARPIVTNLGGRIVKTTGDGVLLEFPSIVAAVECAPGPSFVQPKRPLPISRYVT
jgi:adenylate cyclase